VESEYFEMYLKLQTNSIIPVSKRVTAFSVHNFQTGRVKLTLESIYNKIQMNSQVLVKITTTFSHCVTYPAFCNNSARIIITILSYTNSIVWVTIIHNIRQKTPFKQFSFLKTSEQFCTKLFYMNSTYVGLLKWSPLKMISAQSVRKDSRCNKLLTNFILFCTWFLKTYHFFFQFVPNVQWQITTTVRKD